MEWIWSLDTSDITEFSFPNKKKNFMFSLSVAYSLFNLDLFLLSSFFRLLKINKRNIRNPSIYTYIIAFNYDTDLSTIISEDELLLAIDRIADYIDSDYFQDEEEYEYIEDVMLVESSQDQQKNKKRGKKKKKKPSEDPSIPFSKSFIETFETILNSYLQVGKNQSSLL